MTPTQRARRSDALHRGTDTRHQLCDRIVLLENLAECLAHCVRDECDGCPALDTADDSCTAWSELRVLGITGR